MFNNVFNGERFIEVDRMFDILIDLSFEFNDLVADFKSGSQKWLVRRETSSHFPVIVADNVYTIDEARQAGQVPVLLQTDLETGIATDSIVLSGRLFSEPIIIGESGQGYRPN